MVDFSNKLKMLRTERHLTQLQVAERIGVTKAMVSAYETSTRYPSYDVLIKLSCLLGVSTDYLLGLDSKQSIAVDDLTDDEIAAITAFIDLLRKRHK